MASTTSHTNNHQTKKTTDQAAVERAQWLRAAILGANDGLLSTTSLVLGVAAVAGDDRRSIILSGLAGALAGAFSMAVGEFVSVSTQRDIEKKLLLHEPKLHEERSRLSSTPGRSPAMRVIVEDEQGLMVLPSPHKAAAASAVAFMSGAAVPLLLSVLVVENHVLRIGMIVAVATVALAVLGGVGARLGGSPVKASAVRVAVGGLLAMAITYALLKPFDRWL